MRWEENDFLEKLTINVDTPFDIKGSMALSNIFISRMRSGNGAANDISKARACSACSRWGWGLFGSLSLSLSLSLSMRLLNMNCNTL